MTDAAVMTLPVEIGDLSGLKYLHLEGTHITSLPSSIGRLKNLDCLDLSETLNLRELPAEIGNLSGLEEFFLSGSRITSIPSSIGQLKKLHLLALGKTRLMTLPDEIGNLSGLNALCLNGSRITSLPSSIGQLKTLEHLDLDNTTNLLSLPDEIGNLVSLKTLLLRGSSIKSMPEDAGSLNSLETLALSNLCIASLSNWIGSLSGCIHLTIGRDISKLQEKDSDNILLQLVKDCRSLVYISVARESQFNASIPVRHSLACNRARSRLRFGAHAEISPKLWPLVLKHAARAFRNFHHDTSVSSDVRLYEEFASIAEYEITNHDAIYQLLVDGWGSLIGIRHGDDAIDKSSRKSLSQPQPTIGSGDELGSGLIGSDLVQL
jgi:hypothetical protein